MSAAAATKEAVMVEAVAHPGDLARRLMDVLRAEEPVDAGA